MSVGEGARGRMEACAGADGARRGHCSGRTPGVTGAGREALIGEGVPDWGGSLCLSRFWLPLMPTSGSDAPAAARSSASRAESLAKKPRTLALRALGPAVGLWKHGPPAGAAGGHAEGIGEPVSTKKRRAGGFARLRVWRAPLFPPASLHLRRPEVPAGAPLGPERLRSRSHCGSR